MDYLDVKRYELAISMVHTHTFIHSWEDANELMKKSDQQKGKEAVEQLDKTINEYNSISNDIFHNLELTEEEQKNLLTSIYYGSLLEMIYEAAFRPVTVNTIKEINDWNKVSYVWVDYPILFKLFGFKNWSDLRYPWYEILVNTQSPKIADVKTAISHCMHTYPFFNVCASFIKRGLNKYDGKCALLYLNIAIKILMLKDYKDTISNVIGIASTENLKTDISNNLFFEEIELKRKIEDFVNRLKQTPCSIKTRMDYNDFATELLSTPLSEQQVIATVKKYIDFSNFKKGTYKSLFKILKNNRLYTKSYQNFCNQFNNNYR